MGRCAILMGSDIMRITRSATVAACVVAILSGIVLADPKSDYELLFGEDTRKAQATADTRDDAELAAKILAAAKMTTDAPKSQIYFYQKAYELGIKNPVGHASAIEALGLLEKAVPERRLEWRMKKLSLLEEAFQKARGTARQAAARAYLDMLLYVADAANAAGKTKEALDLYGKAQPIATYVRSPRAAEISKKIKEMSRLAAAITERQERLKSLMSKLAADPQDMKVRTELIVFCVAELDEPPKAVSLLTKGVDEKLAAKVTLAAKKVDEVPVASCPEMGSWYYDTLLGNVSAISKAAILRKAAAYYQRFLALYDKQDAKRLNASLAMAEIKKELARLGAASPSAKPADPRLLSLDLGNNVTMKLIKIPAGSFVMGSPDTEKDRESDEGPQHKVTISKPFHMGVTEVTVAQFGAFVTATDYKTLAEQEGSSWAYEKGAWKKTPGVTWRKPGFEQTPTHPVVCVNWTDAGAFCTWLGKKTGRSVRLPTEAEWEYACRAGTKTRFYYGDAEHILGKYAWYTYNSVGKAHPVGQKEPNAWGLYDMHGNVWESCLDWYSSRYYSKAQNPDPKGPRYGMYHVARSGGWTSTPTQVDSANRHRHGRRERHSNRGFRVVVVPKPPPAPAKSRKPGGG